MHAVLSSATVPDVDKSGAIKKRFTTKSKTAKCIPIPEDVKPWVRDAKSWGHDGKKPGEKSCMVFVSPRIRFKSIKAYIAFRYYPQKGPGSLILMFDGKRLKDYECPEKYEMEDEDQIDCHYDPGE
ncbi:hypothetical protein A1Q2_06578 [Trichosporon asahii var. asahii CBS 8904]|uniref:Rad60/SUMO-like domain-containing protein n=1 Tax=Trichosporon asahii var. asahii (strain CBS 8904) TaxID=1220162 RepID=K1V5F7_TRIAC|nr:hypothetical protein A1Q2_06578 [Trichosporon asahii var. asahii CBS 8904]